MNIVDDRIAKMFYSYTSRRNTEDESQCARASSTWLWGDRVRDPNIFNLSHFTSRCIASLSQSASSQPARRDLVVLRRKFYWKIRRRERENKSVVTNFEAASLHLASFKNIVKLLFFHIHSSSETSVPTGRAEARCAPASTHNRKMIRISNENIFHRHRGKRRSSSAALFCSASMLSSDLKMFLNFSVLSTHHYYLSEKLFEFSLRQAFDGL